MNRKEKVAKLLKELKKPKYWNPCLSELAGEIGMPTSSVFDLLKKLREKKAVVVKVSVTINKKKLMEQRMIL